MKRFLFLTAAAMGLLFASCQKAELVDSSVVEDAKTYTHYLTAGVEDNAETRVGFDENGAFYWNEDDAIAVSVTTEGEDGPVEGFVSFVKEPEVPSEEEEVNDDASSMEEIEAPIRQMRFVYPYGELEGTMGHYSVYPYSASHSIEGDVLTYNLPSEYNVTVGTDGEQINTNAAMWAEIIDGHASFKHLGGFFKIYVQNLPSGGGTLTVNTNTKKLTGDFECDLTAETPIIETADYDPSYVPSTDESELPAGAPDGNVVTINFNVDPDASVTEGIFYIPAPLGTYEFVDVTVTPWNDETAGNAPATTVRAFTNVTIKRCTPAAGTIVVTSAQSQLQEYLDNYERVNLVHNITLTSPLVISKEVTLDLNGKRINAGRFELKESGSYAYGDTHSIAFVVVDGGNLTIIDSSEDNTVYFETATGSVRAQGAPNSHVAYIENGGVLNIKAGNFYNDNNPADGDGSYLIKNEGTLNISGGKFVPCYDYFETVTESEYLPFNNVNELTGGEFYGYKATNAIGILENTNVNIDKNFGLNKETYTYTYKYDLAPQTITTYAVTNDASGRTKTKTLEEALNNFANVPLTESFTLNPASIKVKGTTTLNLREFTLTGQIVNNGNLTVKAGTAGAIVNNDACIETVGVETPQTKATVTVPSVAIPGLHGGLASTSINGGTFTSNSGVVITAENNVTVEITGGTFNGTSAVKTDESVVSITGATINATAHAIEVINSEVEYSDCNITAPKHVVMGDGNTSSTVNESTANDSGDYIVTEGIVESLFLEGGNLTLTQDITLTDVTLGAGKTVILDLGGKTVTLNSTNTYGIINNGDLTIQNGTITTDKNAIENLATLNIDNVTIISTGRGIQNSGANAILTIDATMTSTGGNVIHNNGGNVTINGGEYSTSVANGATIYCDGITNGTDSAWKLTINDGTFVSENFTAVSLQNNYWGLTSAGYANINKGTFDGSLYDLYVGCAKANVDFENCTFTNKTVYVKAETSLTPIAPAYINDEEYAVDGLIRLTPESLKTAIANGGYVHVGADMEFNEILEINQGLTLDLHGHTLEGTNSRFIRITAPTTVTIKNGTILNEQNDGRCVETRTGDITLTLDNVNLDTPKVGKAQQPLTVGGSGDNITVNINKSTINTNVISGYAITTFNPVTMNITESTINGWCALNIKGASGSLGSNGSVFNVTKSTLNGTNNVTEGETNNFSVIKIEDDNVTINVDKDSHINANAENSNYMSFVAIGDPSNHNKQENDPTIKVINGTKVTFATNYLTLKGTNVKFLNLDVYQTLEGNFFKFHKNFKDALNAEGYTTTEEDNLVTVKGLK